ncbi:MAG TPA: FkbM family methyltransferase [Steroidobacteraceae bacterium]|nr:FkbM family methyltransferase [Steroidobacteraceae bacterium]
MRLRRYLLGKAARRLGLDLVPVPRMRNRELGEFLQKLFRTLRVDCVLDVGANQGQFYRFLRTEVGYAGPIVSFEPLPALAERLQSEARADDRWVVKPLALGSHPGTGSMNVMADTVFSSFLAPDHMHTERFAELNTVKAVQPVSIDTLDRVAPEIFGRFDVHCAYLKLDTQGYDLQVLAGAGEALQRVGALQSELSFVPIYRGMPSWQAALQAYGDAGFAVSGFFAVTRDEDMRLIEADCVLVKRRS